MNFLDLFVRQGTSLADYHQVESTDFRLKFTLRSASIPVRKWVAMEGRRASARFGSKWSLGVKLEA